MYQSNLQTYERLITPGKSHKPKNKQTKGPFHILPTDTVLPTVSEYWGCRTRPPLDTGPVYDVKYLQILRFYLVWQSLQLPKPIYYNENGGTYTIFCHIKTHKVIKA